MEYFKFQRRDSDWWSFTLFPIFLLFVVLLFDVFIQRLNYRNLIYLLGQQFFFFCIVMGVNDIAAKAKYKVRNFKFGPSFYLLIICIFGLAFAYAEEESLRTELIKLHIFSGISVLLIYFVILTYNKNPLSDPLGIGAAEITRMKTEYEDKKEEEYKSPPKKKEFKGIKTGEE